MRDPISDVIHFLTFRPLYNNGPVATPWGPIPIIFFWVLLIAAVWIAARVWKTQPAQRNPRSIYFACARFLLGVMWLQQRATRPRVLDETAGASDTIAAPAVSVRQ